MSNYPPGVTGNEIQIRGLDEGSAVRECLVETPLRVIPVAEWGALKELFRKVAALREKERNPASIPSVDGDLYLENVLNRSKEDILKGLEHLNEWLTNDYSEEMLVAYVDECPFEGRVDIQWGGGYEHWECPLCGAEHEDEIDMTPDDPRI